MPPERRKRPRKPKPKLIIAPGSGGKVPTPKAR